MTDEFISKEETRHYEKKVKQITFRTDTYIQNILEGFKISKGYPYSRTIRTALEYYFQHTITKENEKK